MLFRSPSLDKFAGLKTNREAVPATAKIILSPLEAYEEAEGVYTLFALLFIIKISLYLADQDKWNSLFAKEYAAKVGDSSPLFCVLATRTFRIVSLGGA